MPGSQQGPLPVEGAERLSVHAVCGSCTWPLQGKGGIIQAARDGLIGAVRHFLKDPESMQQTDKRSGREAWEEAYLLTVCAPAQAKLCSSPGKTVLHFAAENGRDSILQILLSHGAPVDSKTIDGGEPQE